MVTVIDCAHPLEAAISQLAHAAKDAIHRATLLSDPAQEHWRLTNMEQADAMFRAADILADIVDLELLEDQKACIPKWVRRAKNNGDWIHYPFTHQQPGSEDLELFKGYRVNRWWREAK